jgi:hypothetical protein
MEKGGMFRVGANDISLKELGNGVRTQKVQYTVLGIKLSEV